LKLYNITISGIVQIINKIMLNVKIIVISLLVTFVNFGAL